MTILKTAARETMLSGKGNENGEKTTTLISNKTTLHA